MTAPGLLRERNKLAVTDMWFVENREQAGWMRYFDQESSTVSLIALNAEALQGSEEFGIAHVTPS